MKSYSILYVLFVAALFISTNSIESKVIVARIIDTQGSTLTCDLTIGVFEGTGTIFNGDFTFVTSAILSGCTSTEIIRSEGSFDASNSTIHEITITGEQNTVSSSAITTMAIHPTTPSLERKYLTVSGTTAITSFSITTYVTLVVQGNEVTINGQAVAEGTYELSPNQVFP